MKKKELCEGKVVQRRDVWKRKESKGREQDEGKGCRNGRVVKRRDGMGQFRDGEIPVHGCPLLMQCWLWSAAVAAAASLAASITGIYTFHFNTHRLGSD